MKQQAESIEQEMQEINKCIKVLEDKLKKADEKHNNAKIVTLQELTALGKANPNYTFSQTPDKTPQYYEHYKTYGDTDGSYIYGDIINYCNGEVADCLQCYINFFDENDNYLESYRLRPTVEELADMEAESVGMLLDW